MSERDLEPLASDVEALLDTERRRPDASRELAGRLFAHVSTTLTLPPVPRGGPGGASGGGSNAGADHDGAAPSSAGAPSGLSRWVTRLAVKPLLIGGTTFALGFGTGITFEASRARKARDSRDDLAIAPSVEPTMTARPSSLASSVAGWEPISEPPLSPSSSAEPKVRAAAPSRPSTAPSIPAPATSSAAVVRDEQMTAERALLDMARMSLARGEATRAFDAIDRHAQQFPRGRLREEREAIRVSALVQAGQAEAARGAAERFRKEFPGSLLLPAVNAAAPSIP